MIISINNSMNIAASAVQNMLSRKKNAHCLKAVNIMSGICIIRAGGSKAMNRFYTRAKQREAAELFSEQN